MKHKGFTFYFGLIAIVFGIGAIIYSLVSGETYVIGKFAIILVVGIVTFIGSLRTRNQQPNQEDTIIHKD